MKPPRLSTLVATLVAVACIGAARGSVVQTDLSALTRSGTVLVGIDSSTGAIVHSTDGGSTFSTVRAATATPLRNVRASDSTVVAVGDQGFISRSTNAGQTWSDLSTTAAPAVGPLADAASSDGTFWVTVGQNNSGKVTVEWSADGGTTWAAPTSSPSVGGRLKSVVYDSGTGRWCAVGTDGLFNATTLTEGAVILTSTDGKTWTSVPAPVGTTALNQVATDGAGHLLAVGDAGGLLVSADGGQTFAVQAGSGAVTENLTAVVYSSSSGSFTAGGQDLVQISYTVAGGSAVSQAPVPGGGDIATLVVDNTGQVLLSGGGFSKVASVTLGSLSANYDGTAKSAVATTLPSGLAVLLTYDGSNTAPTNAGNYTVVGMISDTTYTGAATGTLVIAKANQTISFTGPGDRGLSTTPITLSATATSNQAVSFTVISGPAVLTGNSLTLTGYGTVVLQAAQAGNSNYAAATPVQQSFVVAGGFESWQAAHFTTAELANTNMSGPGAIYGQDGMTNLMKYALGLDPKVNTTDVPAVTTTATDWVFTYSRPTAITDVNYAVEVSTDLSSWSTNGVTMVLRTSMNGVDTWEAHYTLGTAPTAFFRLKVTR